MTSELLRDRNEIIEHIYVSNPEYQIQLENIASHEKLSVISEQEMKQISLMTTPPGVLAICKIPSAAPLPDSFKGMHIFYLDAIRDPGNLGTIFRIADWFGLDFLICSTDCVDVYNPKVLQASMGSALRVKYIELSREEFLDRLKITEIDTQSKFGNVFVCDMNGESIFNLSPPDDAVIILGNESNGASTEFNNAGKSISIPGNSLGAESLNVAVAAGIMAAWLRQKVGT